MFNLTTSEKKPTPFQETLRMIHHPRSLPGPRVPMTSLHRAVVQSLIFFGLHVDAARSALIFQKLHREPKFRFDCLSQRTISLFLKGVQP